MFHRIALLLGFALSVFVGDPIAFADESDEKKGIKVALASGKLTLVTPGDWKQVKPRSRILAYEFSVPEEAKEDEPKARVTIMGAGGSIDANIERWFGQFSQPDGKSTKDKAKVEEFEVGKQKVHLVDIPGTFSESMGGGPFAPGKIVKREDYRMLGAIVETDGLGQYFIKMTGPNELLEEQTENFKKMLEELRVNE